ncbi:MAG: DUF4386 domain-containing protein [Candidatus Eiseniibacteriota bacterium]
MNETRAIEISDASLQRKARAAGVLYLLTIVTGVFSQVFVSDRLVAAEPAVTAQNILANSDLFRLGYTVYLIEMACNIAMTAVFYDLLRPAGKGLSFLAAMLGLAGCIIKTMSRLFYLAPLSVLGNEHYLAAFSGPQLESLAQLLLRLNAQGAGMALVFFGFYALVKGWLILRSTFLPRFLGVLSLAGGVGWLAFLSPPFGSRVFPYVALIGLLGALTTVVWLLVKGVDTRRWKEQARAAAF